jgi:hypothetical protein
MNVGVPGHEASRDGSIARRRAPVVAALSALCAVALVAALAPIASALPPDRAYEKVSPNDKNGNDVQNGFDFAAPDGNAATFPIFAAFDPTEGGPLVPQYYSERTPTGWNVRSMNPPLDPVPGLNATLFQGFSDDVATGIFSGPGTNAGGATPGTSNVWRANPDGSFDVITFGQPPIPPGGFPSTPGFGGSSADASLIAFEFNSTPSLPVTAGPTGPDGVNNAYAGNGTQIRLVSVLPDGTASPSGGTIGANFSTKYNAVSDDGSRIFWTSNFGATPPEVYVRLNGTSTEHVSESQRGTPDPNGQQEKTYQNATPDGSFAFFTTGEKLTNNSQAEPGIPDLYRYDVDSGTLVDLTTGDPDGAGVLGVLGVNNSGSRVYFAATGALAPGATDGQPNLYVRDGATTTFITDLDTSTSFPNDAGNWSASFADKLSRVTPSGGHLMFGSIHEQLGYANNGFMEFYVYDLSSDSFECISCRPGGATASAVLRGASSGGLDLAGAPYNERHNLSTDGATAFFVTPERLLPADTNGKFDVYMWDEGVLDLVSTGLSSSNSGFGDASADGDDVFFLTREQLVGIDTDDDVDMYDARVGGGIANQNPPPPPPPCQGDQCQPPPPPQTDPAQPGTADAQGGDQPGAGPDCGSFDQKATKSAAKAKQKKQKVKQLKKKAKQATGAKKKKLKEKVKKAKQKAKQAKQQAKEDKQIANECHNA